MRSCHNSYSLRLRRVLFESLRQMLLWTILKQAALHIDRLKIKLPTLSIVSHRSYTTVVTLLDVRQHRLGSEETCLVLVYVSICYVVIFGYVVVPRVYIGTTWTARAQPGVAPKVLNPKSSAGLRCHAQGAPAAGWQGRTTPADRHRARPGQGEAVDGSPGHNPIVTIVYYSIL